MEPPCGLAYSDMYPTNMEPELEDGTCSSIPCVSNTTFVSLVRTVLKYTKEIDSMNAAKVTNLESVIPSQGNNPAAPLTPHSTVM